MNSDEFRESLRVFYTAQAKDSVLATLKAIDEELEQTKAVQTADTISSTYQDGMVIGLTWARNQLAKSIGMPEVEM